MRLIDAHEFVLDTKYCHFIGDPGERSSGEYHAVQQHVVDEFDQRDQRFLFFGSKLDYFDGDVSVCALMRRRIRTSIPSKENVMP